MNAERLPRLLFLTYLYTTLFVWVQKYPAIELSREVIWIPFVFACFWVARVIPSLSLRYNEGRSLFFLLLMFCVSGIIPQMQDYSRFLFREQWYLLEGYWNFSLVFESLCHFFLYLPWVCVYFLFQRNYPMDLPTQLLALLGGLGLTTSASLSHPVFNAVVLIFCSVFLSPASSFARSAKMQVTVYPDPESKLQKPALAAELWAPVLVILCGLSIPVPEWELRALDFLLLFLILWPRNRVYWIKRNSLYLELILFHSFLLGSVFLIYGSTSSFPLLLLLVGLCYLLPNLPVRKVRGLDWVLILFFVFSMLFFDLDQLRQRVFLLYFAITLRLFSHYVSIKAWNRLGLAIFLLYYAISQYPFEELSSRKTTLGNYVSYKDKSRVQYKGDILYSSFSVHSEFARGEGPSRWLYFNCLDEHDQERDYHFYWISPSDKFDSQVGDYLNLTTMIKSSSKKKVQLILQSQVPVNVVMNFHQLHQMGQYSEWLELFSGKIQGLHLRFSRSVYSLDKLRPLLEEVLKIFPTIRLKIRSDGLFLSTGRTFRSRSLLEADLYLQNFLVLLKDQEFFQRRKFLEELLMTDYQLLIRRRDPVIKAQLHEVSLQAYRMGMDRLCAFLVEEILEADSLNQDFLYLKSLLASRPDPRLDTLYEHYLQFANLPKLSAPLPYMERILQTRLIRELPEVLVSYRAWTNNEQAPFYLRLRFLLQAGMLEEMKKLMEESFQEPATIFERKLLSSAYESLGMIEAASFYQF